MIKNRMVFSLFKTMRLKAKRSKWVFQLIFGQQQWKSDTWDYLWTEEFNFIDRKIKNIACQSFASIIIPPILIQFRVKNGFKSASGSFDLFSRHLGTTIRNLIEMHVYPRYLSAKVILHKRYSCLIPKIHQL